MSLQIVCDSSCDLEKEVVDKLDIHIVPFLVTYGDDKYYKDFYELTKDEFYNTLVERECRPKTSMPTVGIYEDIFEKSAKDGKDVICFNMTSKFSGSFNSATIAARNVSEKYPDRNIVAIDTQTVSIMQGHLALTADELYKKGKSIQEILQIIEELKPKTGAAITVDSLIYLQRGGRIGKVSSIAGDFLSIKPIIKVMDGELIPASKIRTRKKALDKIIDTVLEMTAEMDNSKLVFIPVHTAAHDDAQLIASRFTERTGIKIDRQPVALTCTVGAHIGPSVVGIAYFTEN